MSNRRCSALTLAEVLILPAVSAILSAIAFSVVVQGRARAGGWECRTEDRILGYWYFPCL